MTQQSLLWNMRFDMCDKNTCEAARAGGGGSAIDLHGMCASVKVVTGVGRLRRERCFHKCELRNTEEHCMSPGEGGRLSKTYQGQPCGPLKLDDDGKLDPENGMLQLPQECVSMCSWINNKCMTSCEMRLTQGDCTGTCKWDGNKATGVLEFGGLPDLIACSGEPSIPLKADNLE